MDKIDLRDLRIDNWIYHKDCPIPLQVSGFNGNEVYLKHSFEHNRTVGFVRQDRPSVCSIDDIRLVPLSEEILIKNGFPEDACDGRFPEDTYGLLYMAISYDNRIFFDCNDCRIEIKYVHQLQNILRDFGIEKEISI